MNPINSDKEIDRDLKLLELQRQREQQTSAMHDRSRKFLLLSTTIGLAVFYTGAVPKKIAALGIEFDTVQQEHFITFVGLVILYYFFQFSLTIFGFKLREDAHIYTEIKATTEHYKEIDIKPKLIHNPIFGKINSVLNHTFYSVVPVLYSLFGMYKCLTS